MALADPLSSAPSFNFSPREGIEHIRRGNQTVIFFVHGFLGNFRDTWGKFPLLILSDPELNHCDILCWDYPTGLKGFLPRVPYIGRRLPSIPEVALALKSTLMNSDLVGDYQDIVLVGHSMGGLILQKMINDCLISADIESLLLLDKIRAVLLYATPMEGVQIKPLLLKLHRQIRGVKEHGNLINQIRNDWVNRVYTVRPNDPPKPGRRYIPVTPIFGLQDNVVPIYSAQSVYRNIEGAPGDHSGVCKPESCHHNSYQILKREVLAHTYPKFIFTGRKIVDTNCRIVQRAQQVIFTIGSRSRDFTYLQSIEERLKSQPSLQYWRVLFGPPRTTLLKEHLLRVLELRPPSDRSSGGKTIYISMYDDNASQPEFNICGNERACLLVLPPRDGLGSYSTAELFTEPEMVRGYLNLTHEMYRAGESLESKDAIIALPILAQQETTSHASRSN